MLCRSVPLLCRHLPGADANVPVALPPSRIQGMFDDMLDEHDQIKEQFLTKEVEAHFPEIVSTIVLINVPRVFSTIFPVVKAFMDPITASKINGARPYVGRAAVIL